MTVIQVVHVNGDMSQAIARTSDMPDVVATFARRPGVVSLTVRPFGETGPL